MGLISSNRITFQIGLKSAILQLHVWNFVKSAGIYIINTLSPSVILSLSDSVTLWLCPIAYSSETIGARGLEFWVMLENIRPVVLIYILNDFIDYFFF